MNQSQAVRLRTALTKVYPDAEDITVVAQEDGGQVSIEIGGEYHRFSFIDDESLLLRFLITGSPFKPLGSQWIRKPISNALHVMKNSEYGPTARPLSISSP